MGSRRVPQRFGGGTLAYTLGYPSRTLGYPWVRMGSHGYFEVFLFRRISTRGCTAQSSCSPRREELSYRDPDDNLFIYDQWNLRMLSNGRADLHHICFV